MSLLEREISQKNGYPMDDFSTAKVSGLTVGKREGWRDREGERVRREKRREEIEAEASPRMSLDDEMFSQTVLRSYK